MAFGVSRTVTTRDEKEILKFPVGLHAVKSVVLDANAFAVPNPAWERYIVPVGTILKVSATNPNMYMAFDGTGTVAGILAHDVDLAAQATAASEPVPMFFNGCIFATTAIVGFTQYAADLVADLPKCSFE
jgi:hypothetical protein